MFDGLAAPEHINFLIVFAEGLLSFFSPCVIPLIPVYIVYLAGNAKIENPDGTVRYQRGKVFLQTVCFILGISFAFFLLGISFTALGTFLSSHRTWLIRVGGIVIILLGLYQLGIFNFKFLQKEHKFQLNLKPKNMNPFWAFVLGFTFSFAWTPCVGPALSSVLILASSAKTALVGNLLVVVYSLGFVIPFLILGLFTAQMLNFLKRHQKFLRYTIKAGSILLIVIGIMTLTGWMNGITGYLNRFAGSSSPSTSSQETSSLGNAASDVSSSGESGTTSGTSDVSSDSDAIPAPDFTLLDQYGNEHTLSEYQGKVVFLNFWATWCGPCKTEMPHIQELYEEYGENSGDVVFLGVASPKTAENKYTQEGSEEDARQFLSDNGYTFPTLMDVTGTILASYGISAFPTTFMIDTDGNVYGYVPGMITKDIMEQIIDMTLQKMPRE